MRLTYTSDPPTYPEGSHEQTFLDNLIQARGPLGLGPIYRTLLISPTFAEGFTAFFSAIRYNSTVPEDIRELSMCRVGAVNSAQYEWHHHAPLLRQAGVSEEAVETVRTEPAGTEGGEGEGGLSLRLWRVVRLCDAMTKELKVPDKIFADVLQELDGDERKMVELTLTISAYNAVSRFLIALDVGELKDVDVQAPKAS